MNYIVNFIWNIFMKKNVSILSIGDELLNGFTIDTNSSWLAKEISKYDFLDVKNNLTVKDNYKDWINGVNAPLMSHNIIRKKC